MKNPQVAQEFFETNLPEFIKKDVDLSTLKIKPESFVGDTLRQHIADLLFEVSFQGKTGYFYLLTEHQSTSQKLMPFRILEYMVAIQKQHLEDHKTDVLPFVYPLLVYAGKTKYAHSMDLFSLFGPHEEIARHVWQNPYHLIDLTQKTDEELSPYLFFGTMARIMKHIRDQDLMIFLESIVESLKKIEKNGNTRYIIRSMSYFIEAGHSLDEKDFMQFVAHEFKEIGEENIMTLAEKWQQQGLEKGIQQGIHKGMQTGIQKVALNLFSEGFPVDTILKMTGLTESDLKKITRKH